jgi:hypothetical protein
LQAVQAAVIYIISKVVVVAVLVVIYPVLVPMLVLEHFR